MEFIVANEKEQTVVKTRKIVPPEYLTIKLSSLGKLSVPHVLHFRDYSVDDAMKIGLTTDDNILETLVGILNGMIYEEFDCNNLHESELEEIMLNIFANFWGVMLRDYPFPFTNEEYNALPEETKEKYKKNFPKVDISLKKLSNKLIPDQFKEPFKISNDKVEVKFMLPRVGHIFIATDYCEKKYMKEEQLFHKIAEAVKYNNNTEDESKHKPIDSAELVEYSKYLKIRMEDYLNCQRSFTIVKYGDKDLKDVSIEERIGFYKKISFQMWSIVAKVFEDMSFGIDHDIEVISPIDKKPTIRRFSFRPLDFVPGGELPDNNGYVVTFGE